MPCPGLARCRASCLHRLMVEDYRDARAAEEDRREADTGGWATEIRQWNAAHNVRTFWTWLTGGGWEPYRRQSEPL